jgi:PucR C-terminal helix-turn-helix domain
MSAPTIAPGSATPPAQAVPRGSGRGLRRFVPLLPEVVTAVLARIDIELPELAAVDWRSRVAESGYLHAELRRGLELGETGSGFEAADVARFAAHFSDTARSGATLLTMQRFCRSLVVGIFTELWAWAEPGDVSELLKFSQWLWRQNEMVEQLLVSTYAGASRPALTTADRQQALAERLLAGLGAEAGAADPGLPLAPRYLVVVMADVDSTGLHGLPDGTLSAVADRRRHLLVPMEPAQPPRAVWSRLASAVADRRATAVLATEPAQVPVAAHSARSLLQAAAAIGLPSGLIGSRELALETALAGHPRGLRQVATFLDAIERNARLWETLTTFFALDLDRRRTSEALQLSRSGLALRLDRIAQLTGHDPRTTRGIQVLRSALSARAMLELGPAVPD